MALPLDPYVAVFSDASASQGARFPQQVEAFGTAFEHAGLDASGAVADANGGNEAKQALRVLSGAPA